MTTHNENHQELIGKLLYIAIDLKYMGALIRDTNFSDEEKELLESLYKQYKFYGTITENLPEKENIIMNNIHNSYYTNPFLKMTYDNNIKKYNGG